jgi:hypothetical protein
MFNIMSEFHRPAYLMLNSVIPRVSASRAPWPRGACVILVIATPADVKARLAQSSCVSYAILWWPSFPFSRYVSY